MTNYMGMFDFSVLMFQACDFMTKYYIFECLKIHIDRIQYLCYDIIEDRGARAAPHKKEGPTEDKPLRLGAGAVLMRILKNPGIMHHTVF